MRLFDLTQLIENGMPVYPGERATQLTPVISGPYTSYEITFSSHVGTSIDVPKHVLPDGKTITDYPIERFFAESARVWRPHPTGEEALSAEDLASFVEEVSPADALLICTGWSARWGHESYFKHPFLTIDCARILVDAGFRIVGIDAPNVDCTSTNQADVHHYFLSHDVFVMENLTGLDALPDRPLKLAVFPLPLRDADASPVRAVAWEA